MGKVSGNWLTGAHSGRACNHEDIYTKVNKKTGKCYSVKLCNPSESESADQLAQRTRFGKISSALSAWIKQNRTADTDAYKAVLALFDRQTKYANLRGYMMAKNMAAVQADGSVTITVSGKTDTMVSGSANSSSQPSGGNSGTGTNPGGGTGDSGLGDDF